MENSANTIFQPEIHEEEKKQSARYRDKDNLNEVLTLSNKRPTVDLNQEINLRPNNNNNQNELDSGKGSDAAMFKQSYKEKLFKNSQPQSPQQNEFTHNNKLNMIILDRS